ncbi:cell division protein ZapE [Ectopseudomonas mendocina]|uniref:Cell division protein ZapE n=1 Tax=Ectopseudomonas mendocina TaxID=300 RepID=A0ABZ2RFF0_ECTME
MTSELYQQACAVIAQRGLQPDAAQQRALHRLAEWLQARLQPSGWLRRTPRGAYFYGEVGRGKSLLLDSLFAVAPVPEKRRVHVHALLQEIQQRSLHYLGQGDPLIKVAQELAGEARLLFFDEFHVHDIGDAILLGRLLEQLLKHDCILLFSSNFEPDGLCPNPLYHSRFKPFANLLKKQCLVLRMEEGCDYRPLSEHHWGRYFQGSAQLLSDHLSDWPVCNSLELGRRCITVQAMDSERLWVAFNELCQQPLASADYIQLCQRFRQIVVSAVPQMAMLTLDEQQRWVNFVDIAYDCGVELLLQAEKGLGDLCEGCGHSDFARTRSRLAQLRQVQIVAV